MDTRTIETASWWSRTRGIHGAQWVATYQRSLEGRHRDAIAAIVQPIAPETLLEVGAHCGPNLVRLARACPALAMIGLDVSVEAVEHGRRWLQTLGLTSRIQLNAARFPDGTAAVASGSFDVALSCYTLAYVAPADLDAALFELGRLATRAIVLAEPMVFGDAGARETRSLSGYSEWQHNYQRATQWIGSIRGARTRIVPIDPPVDRLNAILVIERDA